MFDKGCEDIKSAESHNRIHEKRKYFVSDKQDNTHKERSSFLIHLNDICTRINRGL